MRPRTEPDLPLNYLDWSDDYTDIRTARTFDECSLWAAQFGLELLESIPLASHQKVLDIGCGTGFPTLEIAHRLGSTATVVGVDIWARAIQRAEEKRRFYGLENVTLLRADASCLAFGSQTFGLIVSNLGYNNFAAPDQVLLEARRLLKDSGSIWLTTNLSGHMHDFYEIFAALLGEYGAEYVDRLGAHEAERGTRDGLLRRLDRAGFEVAAFKDLSFTLHYLDGSSLLRHSLTRLGFLDGWRRIVTGLDERQVFHHLEKRLNSHALANGRLSLDVPGVLVGAVPRAEGIGR